MRPKFIQAALLAILAAGFPAARAAAVVGSDYYTVEDIPAPEGVMPECNGLSFLPDGRCVAVFDHGEVCIYNPATHGWKKFAEGLHTPLGVLAISDREILVCQRPELTRLLDTDGDGVADVYECVTDQWGLSGNYHEFAYGPVKDAQGNLYVSLGAGSHGGVPRYEVRGRLKPRVMEFGKGAMYSVVPYRGWVVEIGKDGNLIPIGAGFRQPNGLIFDPQGRLLVTDNQGDWVGTSKLFHVERDGFYGHPAALVWRPDWKGPPSLLDLDKMRHEGAILFSHAILANSPGQPVYDTTGGKFGPFEGQMLVTEYNIPRILRVMLEDVAGELQGAVTPLYDGPPMRSGNIRLAFSPDGSLWIGQSDRKIGWPEAHGMQRLIWKGKVPMDIMDMHLTDTGFEFTFTKPVDAASAMRPEVYEGKRYYYQYHAEYGSPRIDIHTVKASHLRLSQDGHKISIDVDELKPGYIYEFTLSGIKAADGTPILNPLIGYTVNRLRDGSSRPIPRPPPTGGTLGSGHDEPPGATTAP